MLKRYDLLRKISPGISNYIYKVNNPNLFIYFKIIIILIILKQVLWWILAAFAEFAIKSQMHVHFYPMYTVNTYSIEDV